MTIKVSDILSNGKDTTAAKIYGNQNNIWKDAEVSWNNISNKNDQQHVSRRRWPVEKLRIRQAIAPTPDRRQRAVSQ